MEQDANHIIFSSAYRRMQKKAQVYIATENDFLRNRLTHTLEVVSIGRMLGGLVVKGLDDSNGPHFDAEFSESKQTKGISKREIVDSIAAACHAHDIGNPPFGHIGEFAIRSWFIHQSEKKDLAATHPRLSDILLNDKHTASDFLRFDGNPQGFRVLTRLQGWRNDGGLRLTYDTLAIFFKYVNSSRSEAPGKKNKFGFFQSEEKFANAIFKKLGLIRRNGSLIRHPFSYIMEAADDIAYCCSDIEDGVKARLIPIDEAIAALWGIAKDRIEYLGMDQRFRNLSDSHPKTDILKYLRSAASHALIYSCYDAFFSDSQNSGNKNYKAMLDGTYTESLIRSSKLWKKYNEGTEISKKYVYGSKPKIMREQGCHQIVSYFMDVFSEAIEEWHVRERQMDRLTDRSKNALMIIHRTYDNMELSSEAPRDPNVTLLRNIDPLPHYRAMIDFISGMTDNYATNMARVMRGTSLMDIK